MSLRAALERPTLNGPRRIAVPALLGGWAILTVAWLAVGSTAVFVLAGLLLGGALVLVFTSSRDAAVAGLVAWGVLEALLYPFLRDGAKAHVTFDRIWILALGAWLAYSLLREGNLRGARASDLLTAAAIVFVVSFGIRAALTTDDIATAMRIWVDAIVLPAILLLVARRVVRTAADYRLVLAGLVAAGSTLAAIGVAQAIFGFELMTLSGGSEQFDGAIGRVRISGPFPAPEPYAVALLVSYAATLAWTTLREEGERLLGGAVAVLQLIAVGLTFIRSAWLAALIVTAVALWPHRALLRSLVRPVYVIPAVVAALAFAVVLGDEAVQRVTNSENAVGRWSTYEQAINVWELDPLVGVGVDRFTFNTSEQTSEIAFGVESLEYPHNSFLGVLAEQGVIGFLPLLALAVAVWWLIRSLARASHEPGDVALRASIAAATLGYLVMSLTFNTLPYGPANAFLAVLLGAVAGRLDELHTRGLRSSP